MVVPAVSDVQDILAPLDAQDVQDILAALVTILAGSGVMPLLGIPDIVANLDFPA